MPMSQKCLILLCNKDKSELSLVIDFFQALNDILRLVIYGSDNSILKWISSDVKGIYPLIQNFEVYPICSNWMFHNMN